MTTIQLPVQRLRDHDPAPTVESRTVSRVRGLGDLMVRRPELAGVYGPADVATEAILWSA